MNLSRKTGFKNVKCVFFNKRKLTILQNQKIKDPKIKALGPNNKRALVGLVWRY
jgi:hypothetical protein